MENCLQYDARQNFSVWQRTGSNPTDINQFRSHAGKNQPLFCRNKEDGERGGKGVSHYTELSTLTASYKVPKVILFVGSKLWIL